MKVSIKDIAIKLKVSPAMVSLVLNGKEKEGRIKKDTAEKIRTLAAELNYTPNRFAKGLKKGKSNILGLIVADISNPFYAKLTRYVEDEAERNHYKIIIGSSDESTKKMASLIEVMQTYQVDGFIIVPAENSLNQIVKLCHEKYPIVLVDRYFPEIQINSILVNNYQTAFKATNYLVKQGCKNIAAFSYKSKLLHFKDRISGYNAALNSLGLKTNADAINYVRFDHLEDDIELGIKKILSSKTKYDGIFFSTDTLALMSIKFFMKLDIDISKRFKIFSFDENSTFDFLNFSVPHSAQPLLDIGKRAVQLLISQIDNCQEQSPQRIILNTKWCEK